MKLMTKRLLAVATATVLTLAMTISAMAATVPSDILEEADMDASKAVKIFEIDVEAGEEGDNVSPTSGDYWTWDGEWFNIDFSDIDTSGYTNLVIFHLRDDGVYEWEAGKTAKFSTASPFMLYGEKKSGTSGSSSSSSSSKSSSSKSSSSSSSKKSPKTGMNDSWMLWLMAAGVFAGSFVIAYNRKRG